MRLEVDWRSGREITGGLEVGLKLDLRCAEGIFRVGNSKKKYLRRELDCFDAQQWTLGNPLQHSS